MAHMIRNAISVSLVIVFIVMVMAGCGRKGPPVAPKPDSASRLAEPSAHKIGP